MLPKFSVLLWATLLTCVTPESPTSSVYHYFITDAYPFVPRCVFGAPASWGNDGAAN
jgi:hypothetical protein